MSFDPDRPIKKPEHEIGCDLSLLSADELQKRITLLEEEINRLKTERQSKEAGKMAAEALFKGLK
ncbi:DUF1192 domain-containing protein [Rhizobium sp.]|jgi:uncharacterized small protein (DUF1192 family)|uniref:DUF1192 domain-containing protein n=1 Tax=Rhizobium sp. TaxID=391 RepID=UPI000E854353|nr:DUF1192 domain-containing protein [Rhizobium sp.]